MEHLNGQLIDYEKTMRSFKRLDCGILLGMWVYYNFIHKHVGWVTAPLPRWQELLCEVSVDAVHWVQNGGHGRILVHMANTHYVTI